MSDDGYLSKNREYLNRLQRERRSKLIRIDYADVSPEAEAIIASLRYHAVGGDNSSILNRIIVEWAEKNGRK
ncbi:MAG: hypothetical protein ABW088_15280 [Sedimenticola sp.]